MDTLFIGLVNLVLEKQAVEPEKCSPSDYFTREQSTSFTKISFASKKKKRTKSEPITQIFSTKPKNITVPGHDDKYVGVLDKEEEVLETSVAAT